VLVVSVASVTVVSVASVTVVSVASVTVVSVASVAVVSVAAVTVVSWLVVRVVELQSPLFVPVVHSSQASSSGQAEKVQHSSQWTRDVLPHSVNAVQESCASQMVEHS